MNNTQSMALGMILGGGLVYFLDRDRGARRRALVRDQIVHAGHELEDAAGAGVRHLRNRGLGLVHEARAGLTDGDVDDRVLEERVRSGMGRSVSNPGSITVVAERGAVILSGDVPSVEVQDLVRAVKSVRGVRRVDNRLTVHTRSDGAPELQGMGVERARGREAPN